MRTRHVIIGVLFVGGLALATVALYLVNATSHFVAGIRFVEVGIAVMAGSVIYSLALDDPESRRTMLGTAGGKQAISTGPEREVDLRERLAEQERFPAGTSR